MTFAPNSTFGNSYVPVYRNYELDDAALKMALARDYITLAYAVNWKVNGVFETVETQNGKQFFSLDTNQQKKRYAFQKCFTIPAIAAGASATITHGIRNIQTFTSVYAVCSTDIPDFRPIPYASVIANANIEINVDYSVITISNGAASPNITSGTVVLEYIKQ